MCQWGDRPKMKRFQYHFVLWRLLMNALACFDQHDHIHPIWLKPVDKDFNNTLLNLNLFGQDLSAHLQPPLVGYFPP